VVAIGVVKGIRDNSNIFFFQIGVILGIEFLYFTIIKKKHGNTGLHILRKANMSPWRSLLSLKK
jgi:hypothetical protein